MKTLSAILINEHCVSTIFNAIHARQLDMNMRLPFWSHERYDDATADEIEDLVFIRSFYDTLTKPFQFRTTDEISKSDQEDIIVHDVLTKFLGTAGANNVLAHGRRLAYRVTGWQAAEAA